MVAIFPNVCLWRRSYAQNWEALTLNNLREFFGQIVYRSPWQKIARTPMFWTTNGLSELPEVRFEVPFILIGDDDKQTKAFF